MGNLRWSSARRVDSVYAFVEGCVTRNARAGRSRSSDRWPPVTGRFPPRGPAAQGRLVPEGSADTACCGTCAYERMTCL